MRQSVAYSPAVSRPWRSLARESRNVTDSGFTLIELLIVTLVLPLVIGAIAIALISVFSLQSSTSGRISDSGDAQVTSANFESDVQGASLLTTDNGTPTGGLAPCETTAQSASSDPQVLGLQWGGGGTGSTQTEVSYVEAVSGTAGIDTLVRNVCQVVDSTTPASTVFVTGTVISSDIPSGENGDRHVHDVGGG